jgi:hypothetical protein
MRRSLGEPLKAYLASFVPDSFVEFATTGGLVVVVTVIRVNQIVCFVIISKKIYISAVKFSSKQSPNFPSFYFSPGTRCSLLFGNPPTFKKPRKTREDFNI